MCNFDSQSKNVEEHHHIFRGEEIDQGKNDREVLKGKKGRVRSIAKIRRFRQFQTIWNTICMTNNFYLEPIFIINNAPTQTPPSVLAICKIVTTSSTPTSNQHDDQHAHQPSVVES